MTYRAISTAQPNDTPSQDQLLDSKINVSLRGGSRLNIQLLRDIAKVWKTPDDFIPSKDLATAHGRTRSCRGWNLN